MPRDSIKNLKFHFGTFSPLVNALCCSRPILGMAIFVCLELADALDHFANDADRELLDSSDQSSCHEASHSRLELSKFLWHPAQPCELVNGAPFVLANEFIGQQELDGEGVRFALELARGEERAVRHEGDVDVWMQDGMPELMRADELQHRLV